MINKSECSYYCNWRGWIHIGNSTPISYVLLQQKIWLSISLARSHTFRVISKIHSTIFNPLKRCCFMVFCIKHSVLPFNSPTMMTYMFVHLKIISIMRIFDKKLKMPINAHMNDDRSVIYDVVLQILKIFFIKTKFFDLS